MKGFHPPRREADRGGGWKGEEWKLMGGKGRKTKAEPALAFAFINCEGGEALVLSIVGKVFGYFLKIILFVIIIAKVYSHLAR